MHRETYYMTMDYIDRFLSSLEDLPKQQLQLIGILANVLRIVFKIDHNI